MKFSKIAGALALLASATAFATPVTIQFNGTLSNSGIDGLASGTALSGQISYDSSTPSAVSFPLGQGVTLTTYAITQTDAFRMQVGSTVYTDNQLSVNVLATGGNAADGTGEALSFEIDGLSINGAPSTAYMLLTLQGSGSALTGQLPTTLKQSDFNANPITGTLFSSTDASAKTADITINAIGTGPIAPVPETSSSVAMMTGLVAMGGLMRQRRKAAMPVR